MFKIVSPRVWEWSALCVILLVGAFLRFYQLEYKSLWVDEIGQVVAAQGGVLDAVRGAAQHVAAPPLDYLVTWLALQVGNNEFILRFAPAAWSILAIAACYALAKHLTRSTRAALVAAYLFALAPLVVRYAQEVRFYSLSIFLTLVCVYAFVRAWEKPTRRRWIWSAGALVAAFYAHYYIVFVVAALVMWVIIGREKITRARIVGMGAAVVVMVVCALPWLFFAGRGDTSAFVFSPPPLGDMLNDPVVGVNIAPEWRAWLDGLGMIVLPLCAVVGCISLWRTRRRWGILLALLLVVGAAGVWGGDYLLHYFYTPRQLLFLVPYYLILVAAGSVTGFEWVLGSRRVWENVAAGGALIGITILFALSLRGYYDWVKDDWRSAARLLENAKAQSIVTEPDTLGTYLVYYAPMLREPLQHPTTERLWVVTLDTKKPHALDDAGWNSIRLDVSPTLNIFYAGRASEADLWREAAGFDLPPQVVAFSDVLGQVQAIDPALARTVAERTRAEMVTVTPPLLDSTQTRLLRKLRRME